MGRLERVAGGSREEAKKLPLNNLEIGGALRGRRIVKEIRDEARETAEAEATKIISLAIERSASEITGLSRP